MAKREKYLIGQATITKPAAANFIAGTLFRGRDKPVMYKRIHSHIGHAQSKGKLPEQPEMPADIFFGWAVNQKGWEKLIEVPGIPVSASVEVTGFVAEANVGSDFSAVPSPIEINELTQAYVEKTRQFEATERELLSTKDHNAAIQAKKDELTLVLSESGKQGGRGKTK